MRLATLCVIVFLTAGCSFAPHQLATSPSFDQSGPHTVYVVSHGWHTGVVLPTDSLFEELPDLGARFAPAPFVELGWGDKGFYEAEQITTRLTLNAILWPSPSVVHAVAVPIDVQGFFPESDVETLCLKDAELSALVRFVANSFRREDNGRVVPTRSGIYGDSQFYQGVGRYQALNTCNTWTAKALASAGVPINAATKLSSGSVMRALSRLRRTMEHEALPAGAVHQGFTTGSGLCLGPMRGIRHTP